MATFYTNSGNQRDANPMIYIPNSYSDTPILPGNMMVYMNPNLFPDSFSLEAHHEILSNFGGARMVDNNFSFSTWRDDRNGLLMAENQGLSLSLSAIPYRDINSEFGDADYIPPSIVSGQDTRGVPSSKYLQAAQQLLDEAVNVRKPPPDKETESGSKNELLKSHESSTSAQQTLSTAERQDLQTKLTKLVAMVDDVDKRYREYSHQVQIVVTSFDAVAGSGGAKPYTALAQQTISRHFRNLRDAITGQIIFTRKMLGEEDSSENGKSVGIPRLRYVDQKLRLRKLGVMQHHAWRPQRGLPESSVSILRAWLFEHFLHPYPKDSDKLRLARQTGLTRSQVSNWFINARVRLWKPMVEEMYKEERGDDGDATSSCDNGEKASKGEDVHQSDMEVEAAGEEGGVSLTLGLQQCDGGFMPYGPPGSLCLHEPGEEHVHRHTNMGRGRT